MKTCAHCGKPFAPARPMQSICSPRCATAWTIARAKAKRAKEREQRETLKPLRALLREAQAAFNAFIRERDRDMPCVSCGRCHTGAYDAGHYLSTSARPELRFDEANVHKQCVPCNQFLSGNVLEYRKRLIRRIGLAEVERLEGPHAPRKWKRDEVAAIKRTYLEKRRALIAQRGQP